MNWEMFIEIKILRFFLFVLFVTESQICYGQLVVEDIFEGESEYSGQFYDYDVIEEIYKRKLDINAADFDELILIPGITPVTAIKIIRYREERKGIYTECGLDSLLLSLRMQDGMIKQFFTVGTKKKKTPVSFEIRQRFQEDFEKSRGFEESYYYSNRLKNYTRINFMYGDNVSSSIHFEKDPGEKDLLDHSVFFIGFSDSYGFDNIVVGDYYLNFAQGLTFYRKRYFAQFLNPVHPLLSRSKGIKGYRSSDENDGFRGIAAEKTVKNGRIFLFLSGKNLDGNYMDEHSVSSLYTSGYHRNEQESLKKNFIREDLTGARIECSPSAGVTLGSTMGNYRYNKNFVIRDSLRSRDNFSGNRNTVISGDVSIVKSDFSMFLEAGRSGSGGYGYIGGALIDRGNFQVIAMIRRYSSEFHSIHGSSYVNGSSENRNEAGEFIGIKMRFTNRFRMFLSFDQFKSLSRTYFTPFIKRGIQSMIRGEYSELIHIVYTVKNRDITDNEYDGNGILRTFGGQSLREKIRIETKKELHKNITIKTRFEKIIEKENSRSLYIGKTEKAKSGILFFLEVSLKNKTGYSLDLRTMHFQSENNLIFYQYERNLPGILSINPLVGSGRKLYVLLNLPITRYVNLSCRYSETIYYGVNKISSGWNEINGNKKRDFGIQCDFSF